MPRTSPQAAPVPAFARLQPTLNKQAFEDLIRDNGVKLIHSRGLPCPIGMVDKHDPRTSHEQHGCSNGYIFERAGEVTCLFNGNSTSTQVIDTGLLYGSTVQVTFPTAYDNSDEAVVIAVQDRLELAEAQGYVTTTQRFQAAVNGIDALQFPAEKVELVVDAEGQRYRDGDFVVRDGAIHWNGPRRPAAGAVCSTRYLYLPFWYVERLLHEIRVAVTTDPFTGVRRIERFPYSALIRRENFGRDEASDPNDSLKHREIPAPDSTESDILA